ncbi:MAG: phosphomethylpyrimidine synthase ThiC [Chloroflexi bacterium]|nr:phosphomethylpyrimidine synthase ThiC [Chloroflexota bacterium]
MTQVEMARLGKVSEQVAFVAEAEGLEREIIRAGVAEGTIVLSGNLAHRGARPFGVGRGLRTKVNANVGTSTDYRKIEVELEKVDAAVAAGADSVMDLSTGGDLDAIRKLVLDRSKVMVGTVPVYQAALQAVGRRGSIVEMTVDDLFDAIEAHARDGVEFATVHCGITLEGIRLIRQEGRVADIVSRGGSFITGWMLHNGRENPLYQHYDRLLEIAHEYDMILSLGDSLRPGCLADATDRGQIHELLMLGELVERAWAAGVQVMVEGPGHVPLDQIAANIQLQKRICKGAPFYVLGPLVTDVGTGYDHITAAIGGAIAAMHGADFLCYVTPAEHLGLPSNQDVWDGVMASRIAGHAADIVKGVKGARERDLAMAQARKSIDWERQAELCLDPRKARQLRAERPSTAVQGCSMCGDFCAMKFVSEYLGAPMPAIC